MSIQVCRDVSDAVVLYLPQRLYLKSFAKLNISVQLPAHKIYGKSISNWELTEKLRKIILPDTFSLLKVSKHSSEVIRFDAELESRDKLDRVLSQLDNRVIQLNDYPEPLKVKVSEAKTDFPIKHSWDSFFRDATDMDEMKPGERPDTIHIANLPISWFIHVHDSDKDALPTESIFRKVFEKFGAIRRVDVPISDPFRTQMKEAMRGITITAAESSMYFEGYIQFSEYMGFVRCMDALRGRKLVRKKDDISEWCHIMVDFDKTKHMTDAAVKRRAIVRERLIMRQRAKEEEERIEKDKIAKREAKERQNIERFEREKLVKMREREEKRKKKRLAKLLEKDKVDVNKKLAEKQQKLLHEQKRLQAIRLIEELFKRIELRPELQRNGNHERYYDKDEISTRYRIVERFKRHQEQQVEAQREMVKQALDGRIVIRSALETKKPRQESPISSLSSEDERTKKRVKIEKLSSPEREFDYNKTIVPGMYPYGFPYHFACAPPPGYPFPQTSLYYPRGHFSERRPGRGRGRGRGVRARMPYFDGPDASQLYYEYFKKLREQERGHGERSHSRRRSRSRTRTRSRSRSRSRSRRRSYSRSRSRSRSRNRRSRSRRTRSRSRRSSSRSRRSKSSRSRSRSRRRSESRSRRSMSRSKSRQRERSAEKPTSGEQNACEASEPRARSRSWSLPKGSELRKSWSKSPKNTSDIINSSREDFLS